jgi:hypothetical protein
MKQPFNTTISVFKDLFKVKDVPYSLSITDAYNRIKNGNPPLIEKINKIRTSSDKEEINKLKSTLIAFMFNGTFSDRSDNGLIEHSGCCILDFDKYPSDLDMQIEREKLIGDKYTLMVFTSPSGNGLKALIRIPKCDKLEHKRRFNAYKNYINSPYFDDKNINISRVCFESYDPNIFLNQYSEEFTEIEEEKGFTYLEKVPTCILQDEEKKINIIMNFKWAKSFTEGNRNAYIFDLAGAFCEYGISQTTCEGFIANHIVSGDFSDNEMKTAIRSAYRKRKFDSRYFEDYESVNKIKIKVKNGLPNEQIKNELNVNDDVINEIKDQLVNKDIIFWDIKKDKKGVETITINPYNYASFLTKNGFNKYYPELSELPTFVRVTENKVRLSSATQIKDFVLQYLLKNELINVWNYCSKSTQLFQENHLNMIDSIHLKMLVDERDVSYIPFKNGVAKVSKSNIELLNYIDVNGYIWENQIIQRDFNPLEEHENDFKDFIKKVCNNDKNRVYSLETTLGYLIHTFKDKTDQKAIIFNDQEIDDNPNGGSGKSLVLTALNNFRKVVKIDGKAFDPSKSDFVYQRVNLDTQVLAFDDVKKNFNFEQLFSLITEGITVNRKNKDEIFIPFERSPKIVITTNYVINGIGSSHERRRHEIEFFQYFNERRSPLTEYGRLLFDSWSCEDWNKFDNYMINNLKIFLNNGLAKVTSINGDAKRLIQATTKDFYDWIEEGNLSSNIRIYNSEIMIRFTSEYKNYKDLTTKIFLKWVKEYCIFKGFEMKKDRDQTGRYFEIIDSNNSHSNNNENEPF